MDTAQTISLVIIVASAWVFVGYGVPKLFPNNKWADLKSKEGEMFPENVKKDYYDYRATLMDTDVEFYEIGKIAAQTGNPLAIEENEVDDPETNKRWRLSGVWQAPVLDKQDLLRMFKEFAYTDGDSVHAQVHDNGRDGDGLWLSFYPCARAGTPEENPEKFGTNLSETAPAALFAVRLTPKQARVIAAALNGAAALQEAQEV